MKLYNKYKKTVAAFSSVLTAFLLIPILSRGVSASDILSASNAPASLVTDAAENIADVSVKHKSELLSPAIAVIAGNTNLTKSGLNGNEIGFSGSDFRDHLGVSSVSCVTFTSLPPRSAGVLMLGSLEIMKNQTVSEVNLDALKFVPTSTENVNCSFTYRVGDDGGYDLNCFLRTTDRLNTAPTFAGIESGSFSFRTYKNISVFGTMPSSDPDGDRVEYCIVSYPSRGIIYLSDRESGEFVYTPEKNYTGKDGFTYTVTDEYGNTSEEMTVSLNIVRSENGTVFSDMIGRPEHNCAITLSDRGVMTGTQSNGKNLFDPDGAVGRAEFLMMAIKAAEKDVPSVSVSVSLSDTAAIPAVYLPYVSVALQCGYIDDTGDFRPLENISSADACSIYEKVFGKKYPLDSETLTRAEAAVMLAG